ncbi:CCR4-NOT transcription complex subunit 3 [Phytophthora ramorum]|uniref:CCR4-NOT transcription complex subunit 3 n=1 Tax=Phytophthora ramorum TaxID=164328 RepID=UPI0030AAF678|nr:CCR4-NOT transcription complex subunit 3 [Phytophthora ramorum]
MAGQRKLLSEIDRTLKKVSEGVDVFNDIWDKVYAASAQNQKEKHEADLKKEIKKLQRFRDQIKTWIGNSDVKDKRPLVETRKLIEQKMEEFKVCEKETKTKAYSKEGLAQVERLDPEQQARQESHAWIQDCLNQFNVQIEALESDVERLHSAKGRNRNKSEIDEKEKLLSRHKWHILKLEQINRLLDNSALEPDQVDELKEDVDYYLEANQEPDFMETYGDDDIYELLDLDTLGAAAQVALPTEQDVGIDDASSTTSASSATAAPPTITTTSGRGKTPRMSATSSMITGIGRAGAVKPIDLKASTPSRSSSASKSDTSPNGIKTDDLKIGKGRSTPQRAKSGSSDKGASKTTTSVPSSPAVGEQRTPVRKVSPPTPQRSPSPSIGKGHVVGTSSSSSSTSPAAKPPSISAPSPATSSASLPPPVPSPSPVAAATAPAPVNVSGPPSGAGSAAPTPTAAASKPRPIEDSPQLTEEQKQVLRLIDESFHFIPESRDSEKDNRYVPRNLYPTPASFPATPSTLFSSSPIFEKLDVDTLFFIFYYQQGSYQQYLAARELKRRTWGYHKKYKTWFKRHEEPQVTGEDYEQGTFVYFDYETGWCQRIKTEFTFEYSFLEDELQ